MGFQKILLKDKISFTHPPQCANEKRPYFKEVTVFLRSFLSLYGAGFVTCFNKAR